MEYVDKDSSWAFPIFTTGGAPSWGGEDLHLLSVSATHNQWLTLQGSKETETILHALVRVPEFTSSTLLQCLVLR